MRVLFALACLCFAASLTACNNTPQNQERVREDTARTTAQIKNDVQAVGQGIRDGLNTNKPSASGVDINSAGKSDLESLPGIDGTLADRIVAHRPYSDPSDLTRKHVLTEAEYDRISSKITASR